MRVREGGDAAHVDADACEILPRRIICRMAMQRGPVNLFHCSGCLRFMLSTASLPWSNRPVAVLEPATSHGRRTS